MQRVLPHSFPWLDRILLIGYIIIYLTSDYILLFLKDFLNLFLERGEGREKEGKINVWLPLTHLLLGTWPTTQECALTGNQTGDPLARSL